MSDKKKDPYEEFERKLIGMLKNRESHIKIKEEVNRFVQE